MSFALLSFALLSFALLSFALLSLALLSLALLSFSLLSVTRLTPRPDSYLAVVQDIGLHYSDICDLDVCEQSRYIRMKVEFQILNRTLHRKMGPDPYSCFDQFKVSSASLGHIFRLHRDSLFNTVVSEEF